MNIKVAAFTVSENQVILVSPVQVLTSQRHFIIPKKKFENLGVHFYLHFTLYKKLISHHFYNNRCLLSLSERYPYFAIAPDSSLLFIMLFFCKVA